MGKMYIAKEESVQNVLTASNSIKSRLAGIEIAMGGASSVDMKDIINATAFPSSRTSVDLKWEDSEDAYNNDVIVSEWAGTKVVRKEGGVPADETDGVLVVNSTTRDQYKYAPFTDTGLDDLKTYYYRWFPYDTNGNVKASVSLAIRIYPAANTTTLYTSKSNIGLYPGNETETFAVFNASDGTINVKSNNANIKASISGNMVTVTAENLTAGGYSVTLVQNGGKNFNGYATLDVPVTVTDDGSVTSNDLLSSPDTITPALVKAIVNSGMASAVFSPGDQIAIKLNGDVLRQNDTVGKTFNDETYYMVILGINHNKEVESGGKDSIHFVLGKDSAKKEIAITGFAMNTKQSNVGGWEGSDMRNKTCVSFFDCLPQGWRNIISPITKYSENVGTLIADKASKVTATEDKIFLLSEYEVHGVITHAVPSEQRYQKQYDYYTNGNSKTRYFQDAKASSGYTSARWLCRSTSSIRMEYFCLVTDSGEASSGFAYSMYSFAPGFAIIADS